MADLAMLRVDLMGLPQSMLILIQKKETTMEHDKPQDLEVSVSNKPP